MTREEAKRWIYRKFNSGETEKLMADLIIQALEQEPCEDAISRRALLEEIENGIKAGNYEEGYEEYSHINDMDDIIECIKYADSIQPKPKTGHWIRMKAYEKWGCSECSTVFRFTFKEHYYCPNCGAKMESEDKE